MSDRLQIGERSLLIRPYDAAGDLERCMILWRRASEVGHPFLDAATLDADGSLVRERYMPAADIRVAETEGAVVGFIALLRSFIGGLFVDPSRHGQGIGRALVLDALRRHRALDVEVYEANNETRSFYARLGFAETGRRERDDQDRPLPLIAMRLAG
ncbi:GNAT family N-acetyltransferase [Silicimonas algicola]|uniref:Putative acetyltransferase n=1 Tax=Silicimonas algicola TaxID=1826607 RepID=A0A316FSB9_9RHOB|nr:GNAT family N-acetyltransferase [Silicimonas algicola]AZQ67628.1 GNAT family N-acetyltransferase [Silicimonas algicola]PWK51661.1 putative acetyltransferase [Silicimonas algicola]